MANVTKTPAGYSLQEGITESSFRKGTVRNELFTISFKDVRVPAENKDAELKAVCDFLSEKLPSYSFHTKSVCTDIEFERQGDAQFLKRLECQLYW